MDLDHWSESSIVTALGASVSVLREFVHKNISSGFALRNCSVDCNTTAIETAIDVSAILSGERRVVH